MDLLTFVGIPGNEMVHQMTEETTHRTCSFNGDTFFCDRKFYIQNFTSSL